MLTRKNFRFVQVVRGLSIEEIIHKTGISAQAFMAMLDERSAGKDPSKLISGGTFQRLSEVMGLRADMSGMRLRVVNEWRFTPKKRKQWFEAVTGLSAPTTQGNSFFGENIELAVIARESSFLGRKGSIVLLHDIDRQVRIAITQVDAKAIRMLSTHFGAKNVRQTMLAPRDFEFTCRLLENGVYRPSQFDNCMGDKSGRYSWDDVLVASKEFGFKPEELINMMVDMVRARTAAASTTTDVDHNDSRPRLVTAAA
jgi:hypothetical protein